MGNKNSNKSNISFEDEDKSLIIEQIENLFEIKEEFSSYFEKLPKTILAEIIDKLDGKDLLNIWCLNRFFLRLISESKYLWKKKCDRIQNLIGIK